MNRLGEILYAKRKAKKLSLARTSELAGVAKGYLHELENSEQANPSLRVMAALTKALGLTADDWMKIFTEADPK